MNVVDKEFLVSDISDFQDVAKYLKQLDHNKIICLKGDLGAGKTTFVKVFCKYLESKDETSSPTFSIVNEYSYTDGTIYHFDLYRLNDSEELMDIGIDEYLSSGSYCLIEWPEMVIENFLEEYVLVTIEVNDMNRRKVLISKV